MSDNQVLEVEQIETVIQPSEMTREEKRDFAKSRNILEVADALGISLQKKGRNISWTEHPSFFISPDKNRFKWFSQDLGGDPISLVQAITEKSYSEAVEFLLTADLTETEIQYQEPTKKPFKYYLKDSDDFSLARDYLVNEREIDGALVDKLHQEGYLVQAKYAPDYPENNRLAPCVVAKWEKEGKVVGGTIQGLEYDPELYGKRGRDKRIMANVEKDFGFSYTIGTPNKVIFAESFIDLLSYWSLSPGLNDCLLVDLEGLKVKTVEKFFETLVTEKGGNIKEGIRIAVDNDVSGQAFVDKLSVYEFSEQENFILSMPDNLVVTPVNKAIYDKVGQEFQVDPVAIAAVHKAFVNGNDTNRLANPWKNDQFFGKYLKPTDKEETIDVEAECRKVASALAAVKKSDGVYDFQALTAEGPFEQKKMGQKIEGLYNKYVFNGIKIKETIINDMNDKLKEWKAANPDLSGELGHFWYDKPLSSEVDRSTPDTSNLANLDQYEPIGGEGAIANAESEHVISQISQSIKESEVVDLPAEEVLSNPERMTGLEVAVQQQLQQVRESIQKDQQTYEESLVTLPPHEIIQQSDVIVQRKMIADQLMSWLDNYDPTYPSDKDLLSALESVKDPVTKSVPIVKETPMMAMDLNLFNEHFPSEFIDSLKVTGPVLPALSLPESALEKLDVLELSLTQELNGYDEKLIDPALNMRLSLQLEFLSSILRDNQIMELKENKLVPGINFDQLVTGSKEQLLASALLEQADKPSIQLATEINAINHQFVPVQELAELNAVTLSAFKEWANTYDGIGKEYLPLEEINDLEVTDENVVYLEAANTWFDSMGDYLQTHKETNFGQSLAFKNANEFLVNVDNPNRDLIVAIDKVAALNESLTMPTHANEDQAIVDSLFSHTTVSWARYDDGSWTLIPVPDFKDPDSSELLPVIVVDVDEGKDTRLFDNFTEYEAFTHEYIGSEFKRMALEEKVASVENDLKSLSEWASNYEGLDRDIIPKTEIESLHVVVERPPKVESERVFIADVIDGGYNRYYDSIDQFLASFESNPWHDTMSHQSAIAYVSAQGEPEKQQYELTRQHVIALKDSVLNGDHSLPEEAAKAAIWDNIFVAGYDEWQQSPAKQMIYYQDPTRVGNPVYFENEEKAQRFVTDLVSRQEQPDLDKNSKGETRSRGFFRRERQDRQVVEQVEVQAQSPEKQGVILPIPGLEIAEDRPDVTVMATKENAKESVEVSKSVMKEVKENATTKDLIEQARQGAKDFLQTDRYKSFLKTMSKFHNYSWSNTMLIMQQMPNAKVVAGFQTWKKQFNRHVTKGQKGIKILAPVFTKEMKSSVKTIDGKKQEVEEEVSVQRYRQATVFDVSQTEGDPLPTLVTELQGNVKDYSQLFEAIASTTDYKIDFEDITSGAKGYCHFQDQRIAIKTGMSEVQTIKTLVHEITHSQLHDPTVAKQRDRRTMEVEAESTAFAVCSHFNIDSSDYSFGYLASWGSTKEVSEITQSFSTIQKQADSLISAIHVGLEALSKEQTKGKGLTEKLENARHQSKEYNQDVKKSQAKAQTRAKQKPEKEK